MAEAQVEAIEAMVATGSPPVHTSFTPFVTASAHAVLAILGSLKLLELLVMTVPAPFWDTATERLQTWILAMEGLV
jgi:hypothetical protein